jgi:hypothetical protein
MAGNNFNFFNEPAPCIHALSSISHGVARALVILTGVCYHFASKCLLFVGKHAGRNVAGFSHNKFVKIAPLRQN